MKKIRLIVLGCILCTGLFTSCTKQELNEEEELTSYTDKRNVRRPGSGG